MTTALALLYLLAFQLCALPAIVRLRRKRQSDQLSVWREWLLLFGVSAQFAVMWLSGVRDWRVLASPVLSFVGVAALLGHIYAYRERPYQGKPKRAVS